MAWLLTAWRWIATSRAGQAVGAGLAALAGVYWIWRKGRSQGHTDAEQKRRDQELEAHDRINEADIGIGATDGERRKRLRELGDKWNGT